VKNQYANLRLSIERGKSHLPGGGGMRRADRQILQKR